jgi:hypothetical protein
MDDRTEELKELFVQTTGEESVTEDQQEGPGDLSDDVAAADATERVQELIARMRERYAFESGFDDETLTELVVGFHADESDGDLADQLGTDEETVFTARMDLHLIREADRDAPFPFKQLRELVVENVPLEARADRLESKAETVEHYSQVAAAELRSTRANHRFVDEFAELLTDTELTDSHAATARDDGLQEAAEDIETNTQL